MLTLVHSQQYLHMSLELHWVFFGRVVWESLREVTLTSKFGPCLTFVSNIFFSCNINLHITMHMGGGGWILLPQGIHVIKNSDRYAAISQFILQRGTLLELSSQPGEIYSLSSSHMLRTTEMKLWICGQAVKPSHLEAWFWEALNDSLWLYIAVPNIPMQCICATAWPGRSNALLCDVFLFQ